MRKRTERCIEMKSWLPLLSLFFAPGVGAGSVDIVFLDSFESGCGNLIYSEPFALADASAWPVPWSVLGNVASADIQQQRARLRPEPTGYSLARMGAAIPTQNVEVRFTLRLEDAATQGVGFYVRQNGGYLQQSATHGQGYATFIEGDFRGQPGIGLWQEQNGIETQIAHSAGIALGADVDYRVRYQVVQTTPTQTQSRAKLWADGDPEPDAWQVNIDDATVELQNVSGGIAVDSWSSLIAPPIAAHTFVDDIELVSLCSP